MKRCCFVLIIVLYTIWFVGCGRRESTLTEDVVTEPTIPFSLSMAEEHDISVTDYPAPSTPAAEEGIPEYEYPKMTDLEVPSEAYEVPEEDGQSTVQSDAQEELEEDVGEPYGRWEYVDFSVIEENHEILEYDICGEPRYDWENTLLGEEEGLRRDAEEHERYEERILDSKELDYEYVPHDFELDYFTFDFNDDGLEDYLVCMSNWEYCGSGGNEVRIYIQEEGGTLKEVLSIHDDLHWGDGIHARFTVLNEKADGYYAIVLTSNRILRYDSNTDGYEFHKGE